MRRLSALLIAAFPLAACGGGAGSGANPNGAPVAAPASFDRADYRQVTMASCRRSQNVPDNPVPPETRERYCTCVVDQLLRANDNQLRRFASDRPFEQRAHRIVVRACSPVMFGLPPDPLRAPPEETGGVPH